MDSEINPPPLITNVVCKYLRQFLGASFGIATHLVTLSKGQAPDLFLQSDRISTPKFPEVFPGIDLVPIICVRYCYKF